MYKPCLILVMCIWLINFVVSTHAQNIPFMVDNFETDGSFRERSGLYQKEPSRALSRIVEREAHSGKRSLGILYEKENEGWQPTEDMNGGWCGYYMVIKKGPRLYFDASNYSFFTFWVKGTRGGENFKIGFADQTLEKRGASFKTQPVTFYLESDKITKQWQKVSIPLDELNDVETDNLASFSICFDGSCYTDGRGTGVIFVDDISFE